MWRTTFLASFLVCGMLSLGCHHHHHPSEEKEKLPDALAVKGPVVLRMHAQGVQVYTWQAETNTWKFKEPQATLSSEGITGKHYAGPTWECDDGSKVVGNKIAESPSPMTDAVPWLLLEATSHAGNGKLSQVTFIQRIKTTGGKAPTAPGTTAGEESRVPYTAEYVFYGASATRHP